MNDSFKFKVNDLIRHKHSNSRFVILTRILIDSGDSFQIEYNCRQVGLPIPGSNSEGVSMQAIQLKESEIDLVNRPLIFSRDKASS